MHHKRNKEGRTKQRATNLSKRLPSTLTNFDPLLQDIRKQLGLNWTFYNECLTEIIRAAARQEDTTAWFKQMQTLVAANEGIHYSHDGVVFLLREMIRGETSLRLVNDMPPPPLPARVVQSTMSAPATTEKEQPPLMQRTVPRLTNIASTQPDFLNERMPILPFDFNPSLLTTPGSATFPPLASPNVAYHGEPRVQDPTPPADKTHGFEDPVLYSDSTFKEDVQEFFGLKSASNVNSSDHGTQQMDEADSSRPVQPTPLPAYDPAADDLEVWIDLTKDQVTEEEGGVKNETELWRGELRAKYQRKLKEKVLANENLGE